MSYLAGPLTREQIKRLAGPSGPDTGTVAPAAAVEKAEGGSLRAVRPVVPPAVPETFVRLATTAPGAPFAYRPRLIAAVEARYLRSELNLNERRRMLLCVDVAEGLSDVDWSTAEPLPTDTPLDEAPLPGALFADCPVSLLDVERMRSRQRSFERWFTGDCPITLYRSAASSETSRANESEQDFRIRLKAIADERRDAAVAKLRARYAGKLERARAKVSRSQQAAERESQQASGHKLDAAISFGGALLGALFSRRRLSAGTLSRVSGALRKAGKIGKETGDIARAEETAAASAEDLAELARDLEREIDALENAYDPEAEELEEVAILPRANDVHVTFFGIGWIPAAPNGG
jgi:hypothetical protein